MRHFPAFLDLRGRRCLVVGPGAVAERKAEALRRAGAKVQIVAQVADLADVAVVVVANGDAAAATRARDAGIPVNVVDRPALSTFVMPAIVERGPLTVAIGTGGAAPVLAGLLRARIEQVIPAAYGQLAALAESCRDLVRRHLPEHDARRLFWRRALTGRVADLVFAGRPAMARAALRASLAQEQPTRGRVALVGAGPGDPELLTLKALRLLQEADVVVYDRLVSQGVLDLARRDAERVFVGKARDQHTLPQGEINQLQVRLARDGKRVVRLKGGDPLVFGRGGEELEELAAAGIDVEVVPGISAANGCAAYAGIPLTHRDHAQAVTFVTGHTRDGKLDLNWAALAAARQTLVIYMGIKSLPVLARELVAHGLAADTPAAVVENGSTPDQRVVAGTVASLPARAAHLTGPALVIVGSVVSMRERLAWFEGLPGEASAA